MEQFKKDLLKISWRKSPFTFLRLLLFMLRDKYLGPCFQIFVASPEKLCSNKLPHIESLNFQVYDDWSQIESHIRETIDKELQDEYWGKKSWFDLGWKLWIGTINNQLAILSWARPGAQCSDFVLPLTGDCALVWQTVTARKFRGRGLLPIMLHHISKHMFAQGGEVVYCTCRDYSYPSVNAMLKVGFEFLGRVKVKKSSKTGIFYMQNKIFHLG